MKSQNSEALPGVWGRGQPCGAGQRAGGGPIRCSVATRTGVRMADGRRDPLSKARRRKLVGQAQAEQSKGGWVGSNELMIWDQPANSHELFSLRTDTGLANA